jgi:hypothetical protein
MHMGGRAALAAIVAVWLAAVLGGSWYVWRYKTRPGAVADNAPSWPERTGLAGLTRHTARPTLLAFIHPECPCSRATLRELARLLTQLGDRVATHVVFAVSNRGENWDFASQLRGVTLHVDANGEAAARFGALTSGHTLLYDSSGLLRFSGGITAARGHEGDSSGRMHISSLVLRGQGTGGVTPVFGCALREGGAGP